MIIPGTPQSTPRGSYLRYRAKNAEVYKNTPCIVRAYVIETFKNEEGVTNNHRPYLYMDARLISVQPKNPADLSHGVTGITFGTDVQEKISVFYTFTDEQLGTMARNGYFSETFRIPAQLYGVPLDIEADCDIVVIPPVEGERVPVVLAQMSNAGEIIINEQSTGMDLSVLFERTDPEHAKSYGINTLELGLGDEGVTYGRMGIEELTPEQEFVDFESLGVEYNPMQLDVDSSLEAQARAAYEEHALSHEIEYGLEEVDEDEDEYDIEEGSLIDDLIEIRQALQSGEALELDEADIEAIEDAEDYQDSYLEEELREENEHGYDPSEDPSIDFEDDPAFYDFEYGEAGAFVSSEDVELMIDEDEPEFDRPDLNESEIDEIEEPEVEEPEDDLPEFDLADDESEDDAPEISESEVPTRQTVGEVDAEREYKRNLARVRRENERKMQAQKDDDSPSFD